MARAIEKLTPAGIRNLNRAGMYGDGGGLWLHVGPNALDTNGKPTKTGKSWIFRFMLDGKAREMGLGPLYTIGLSEARDMALACRKQILAGDDPLDAKHSKRKARKAEAAKTITFQACAIKYIAANRAGWRNEKHAYQWNATLATYVYPTIGTLAVGEIDTGHVTKILEPIWTTKSETASRVRGRIETILNYAATHGWRVGENPARWRGHLENVFPKKSKVSKVRHYPALPWPEIGGFIEKLVDQQAAAALALRFTILTAARTSESIGTPWTEIDFKKRVWTVPADRMKGGREHRVPLTDGALAVLHEAKALQQEGCEYVFPGGKVGAPLSNMAMLELLTRMGRGDVTVHGFRSTFKDWSSETGKATDITEAALAHMLGNKTSQAYQRGDLLDRRRALMEAWDAWCARMPDQDNVVELSQAARA